MHTLPATGLRQQAEMLASLSLKHLSSATRNKLADDDLSVNAYPTDCGGFVYVGAPKYRVPSEPDLAMLRLLGAPPQRVAAVWTARLPVDIRHNAKIDRTALAATMARRLSGRAR